MFVSRRQIAVATLLMSMTFNVWAQGSIFPQGSGRPPDGGDPRSRRADVPDDRKYEYGKEIYAVKLACPTCPLADKPFDETTARLYLSDDSIGETLNGKEDDAVRTYLRKMFPQVR